MKAAQIWVRDEGPAERCIDRQSPTGAGATRSGSDIFPPTFAIIRWRTSARNYSKRTIERASRCIAFSLGRDTQDPMRRRLATRIRPLHRCARNCRCGHRGAGAKARNRHCNRSHRIYQRFEAKNIHAARGAYSSQLSWLPWAPWPLHTSTTWSRTASSCRLRFEPTTRRSSPTSRAIRRMIRSGAIADRRFTRHEFGLPPAGFVFCCFNSNYKITPATFDSWMRILGRTPARRAVPVRCKRDCCRQP